MNLRDPSIRDRASLIWLLAAVAGSAAIACARADTTTVSAVQGSLSLRAGTIPLASLPNALSSPAFTPGARYVLSLNQPLTAARQQALFTRGVVIAGYYPTWSYLVTLDGVAPAALRELNFVARVTPYQTSWKLDRDIGTHAFSSPERLAIAATGDVALRVLLFPGERLDGPTATSLSAIPGLVVHGTEMLRDALSLTLTMPAQNIGALATLPALQFAEELPEYTNRDINQRWIVQSNVQNSTPLYTNGITGAGQIVGVIDGLLGSQHCAFLDAAHPFGPTHRKIIAYNAPFTGYDQHGTHVAGIIAGDPGSETNSRGVAYAAKIAYNLPPSGNQASFLDRFNLHYSQGARVNTNSWGNDGTIQYDYACAALDTFLRDNEDALVVFAVSNASTVRNPENAKNIVGVTRTGNFPSQDDICAISGATPGAGPTLDGRRKPDIAAPGCNISSSFGSSGCFSSLLSGTSMAAPAIGGVSTLMRQYFTDGFYPTGTPVAANSLVPTGALLKAMVVNSGVDMLPAGYPSNQEGWGRVLADNVLKFPGDTHGLIIRDVHNTSTDALTTDGVREYRITVSSSAQPFRATMAFTDEPATIPTTVTPVNDLDLMVVDPSGTVFLGNNLVAGASVPGGLPDPINNVEQVRIESPAPGIWTIRIRGTAVNLNTQGFSLSITGAVAESVCRADFNTDGVVDFFDYLDFVSDFSAGAIAADFNHDSIVDFFDYLDFVEAFAGPC